jgi:outer membrane lipoprotein SlyB
MIVPVPRKTHPIVLTAAIAVTFFSLLGSAAITGLIPSAHSSGLGNTPDTTGGSLVGKSGTTAHVDKVSANQEGVVSEKSQTCKVCGIIESIKTVAREGEDSGLGTVVGGVTGGVIGNQIGKGKGNTLMTIIGIGGGAYAGHTIEKNMNSSTAYLVKVRMEDGTYRKVTQIAQPDFSVGDHVRVVSGHITSA